jgi:nucleotide-binding universal stress UspA family protein
MYKKILLAADGSSNSDRAADHAVNLARLQNGSEVEIIYVLDYTKSKSDVLHTEAFMEMKNERLKKLKGIETKLKDMNIPYKIVMQHGEPGPAIISYCNENHFDILIVGSRGLNSLQEMVLGSVSHKVAKRVHCPVLIVK